MPVGPAPDPINRAGAERLNVFALGMFNHRIRRILALAGYQIALGLPPKATGLIGVWGRTSPSERGRWVAARQGCQLLTVEDSFLRSVQTGRSGEAPLGLVIDRKGVYFDCNQPSDLEDILNAADLSDPGLLARARAGIERVQSAHLSKYNAFDPDLVLDDNGYILVIDQTRNDASIRLGGADATTFNAMLAAAKAENPGKTILIKTHPEVTSGHRQGHFGTTDQNANTRLFSAAASPWQMLANAEKVYAVTSLMGFEAILAGHRPHLFGKPFYGGWGLSEDRQTHLRRDRALSVTALFSGAMLRYPIWYDPYRDRLCDFEDVADTLQAQARAWREDHLGYDAFGMRLWKRGHLKRFFGGNVRFATAADFKTPKALVWAAHETPALINAAQSAGVSLSRLEDGFLRSKGLGAELVPPLSLVADDLGIYYDPNRPSRLEAMVNASGVLSANALKRAENLRQRLIAGQISKYNIGTKSVDWPTGKTRILVPGQVEDDASIRFGAGDVRRNIDLLKRTRQANPDAFIIYKPHPDVEAGLRPGMIENALEHADAIAQSMDAIAAIENSDEVWTMTSLLGFEALLRGKSITCLGRPFYAGWGLTNDLGESLPRRITRPTLVALIHAVLIEYPRYFDPETGLACPVEVVVDRLDEGVVWQGGRGNRMLSKLQGIFASRASLWR